MTFLRRYGVLFIVLPALVLLFARSAVSDPDAMNQTVDAARRLRELDARIDVLVLEESAGLSLDYDALTHTFREMHRLEAQIAASPSSNAPAVARGLERTTAHIQRKERIVEDFQSSNSALHNSSTYLPIVAAEVAEGRTVVAALLASVVLCRSDCNPDVLARIQGDIAQVAALPRDPKLDLLIEHARVFASLAPKVERATRQLSTMDAAPYDELYVAARNGREAAVARANHYRIGLIALSVALVVTVVSMIMRLRRALRDYSSLNETLEARVAERTRELSTSREQFKQLAEEGRILEAELRSAQKLESLGRLSAGIAHEINTPVQFISDNMHYIKEAFTSMKDLVQVYRGATRAELVPEQRVATAADARIADEIADTDYALENVPAALDSALEGLGRIATIVKSLKDFSHPDKSEKSAVDLNSNIRSTATITTNEYKHVADLTLDLGHLGPVACHGGEINQVLLNLIVNAAHAIGDVVKKTNQRGQIEIRTWQEPDWACISVRDTGAGIPDDIRDKIFDPFFTTKEVGKGTGQGLALARRIIVDKHGGVLDFVSAVGEGTTFTIKLPCERASMLAMVA